MNRKSFNFGVMIVIAISCLLFMYDARTIALVVTSIASLISLSVTIYLAREYINGKRLS